MVYQCPLQQLTKQFRVRFSERTNPVSYSYLQRHDENLHKLLSFHEAEVSVFFLTDHLEQDVWESGLQFFSEVFFTEREAVPASFHITSLIFCLVGVVPCDPLRRTWKCVRPSTLFLGRFPIKSRVRRGRVGYYTLSSSVPDGFPTSRDDTCEDLFPSVIIATAPTGVLAGRKAVSYGFSNHLTITGAKKKLFTRH